MVKVAKTTADQRWGRNEHHFHFKCAKAKGGLEENDRAVNQLLAIVRTKNNIGQDKKRKCLFATVCPWISTMLTLLASRERFKYHIHSERYLVCHTYHWETCDVLTTIVSLASNAAPNLFEALAAHDSLVVMSGSLRPRKDCDNVPICHHVSASSSRGFLFTPVLLF